MILSWALAAEPASGINEWHPPRLPPHCYPVPVMPESSADRTARLAALDHAHAWHPFTPMRQWRQREPLIIEAGEGEYLIDTAGNRYIDGTSSLWCNVHGHRNPQIDQVIRDQLDRIAHTTMLGLASVPSIELAARLCAIAPKGLNKVFYSDAGATALEVAFKMAVGYWFHTGQPQRTKFIGFTGAYHGDTTGAMSIGYSEVFHKPYVSMVFPTLFAPVPDPLRDYGCVSLSQVDGLKGDRQPSLSRWPNELVPITDALRDLCLRELENILKSNAAEVAAIVIEPIMQGAAGMICQPPGFLRGVADLAKKYNTLLIADEVATGFGRTGKMFACEHENVRPDIMCLGKGLTGGYLPLAATLCTDAIEQAFTGELDERKALYHGHTFCGNSLACAAALASLDLFESSNLLDHIGQSAARITDRLDALRNPRDFPNVVEVRQRGLMIGVELSLQRPRPFSSDGPPVSHAAFVGAMESLGVVPAVPTDDYGSPLGAALCDAMRRQGLIIRPLGNTLVLMPIPAMSRATLDRMLDITIETLRDLPGLNLT